MSRNRGQSCAILGESWIRPLRSRALFLAILSTLPVLSACSAPERGILFSSTRDGIQDVYVMEPDGSHVRRLTLEGELGTKHSSMPTWSPNGDLIAFSSDRPIEDEPAETQRESDVFLMNSDGGGIRRLTVDSASDGQPDFSPDGKEIAFVSSRDGNPEVYGVSLENGAVRRSLHHGPERRGRTPEASSFST